MAPDKGAGAQLKRAQVTFLNEEELARMFACPDVATEAGLYDRAILELLLVLDYVFQS